jgi:hypothetical protein
MTWPEQIIDYQHRQVALFARVFSVTNTRIIKLLWFCYPSYSMLRRHHRWGNTAKGHSGNIDNDKCDWLATNAAKGNNLAIDFEYERIAKNLPPFCSQGSTIQSDDNLF